MCLQNLSNRTLILLTEVARFSQITITALVDPNNRRGGVFPPDTLIAIEPVSMPNQWVITSTLKDIKALDTNGE